MLQLPQGMSRQARGGSGMKAAKRVGVILALACTCAGLYAGTATASQRNIRCGSSLGGMYACTNTDFYTSTCGGAITHYAFTDTFLTGVRANSGWWSSGASVDAEANAFPCTGSRVTKSASIPVTINWYSFTDGTSNALTLNWPPLYAGPGWLFTQGSYTVHYGTHTYGQVAAKWCAGC
jgi:hypothetical protein